MNYHQETNDFNHLKQVIKQGFRYIPFISLVSIMLSCTLMSSCSDEEEFTSDRSAVLSFSQDTIRFDTIFTGITSVTERILIHNRGNKGLKIKNVRLESNGTSGFMINVDGQNGSSVQDVQVLKHDSVFMFVKANIPANTSMKPTQITDAVIFTLESGVEQKVILQASGQNCQILKAEMLTSDKVISEDELPYVVYDSLVVAENTTLKLKLRSTSIMGLF